MKTIQKTLLIILVALGMLTLVTACNKNDDLPNNGVPAISYVRITNPESSDSLLVGAKQGNLIAIVGQNLGDTRQVWFNDQKASLTSTYITNTSILVNVPSPIPIKINNKIKIYFGNGDSLLYDFKVQISKPTVNAMQSEFVNTGEIATINGDFFYNPITVAFTGGVNGEIVNLTDKIVQVRVPAGALPGPITVKTNFGETKSNFWFRDNRNVFISSDPFEGWWNSGYVVTNPGPNDPPKISGNYIRVSKMLGAWSWNEVAGGPANAMPVQSKNIPDAAITKPEDYNIKFEINTLKPFNANRILFNIGLTAEDNNGYVWNPPYDSKGQWNTVTIPFEEMVRAYANKPVISSSGYWSRILIFGGADLDADIAFDNLRIVPKK